MSQKSTPGSRAALVVAALLVTSLAACAAQRAPTGRWERDSTGPEQLAFDQRQCEVDVEQAANGEVFDNPAIAEPRAAEDLRERRWRREMFHRCMVERGYRYLR